MPSAAWACCCDACADCAGTAATATVTLDGVLLATTCQGPCAVDTDPVLGGTIWRWQRVDAGAVDGTYSLAKTVSAAGECRWELVTSGPTLTVVQDGGDPDFNPAVVDCDSLPGETDPDNGGYSTFHRRSSTQIKITVSRRRSSGGAGPWTWYVTVESYGSSPTGIPPPTYSGTDPGPIAEGALYYTASTEDDCATPPAAEANDNTFFNCVIPGKDGTATVSFP